MDIVSIFVGLALAFLVGAFIARPLTGWRSHALRDADRELSTLRAEHDRILDLIEELETDHAIGKILDDDYHAHRAWLMQQGAKNLKKIDALQAGSTTDGSETSTKRSLEECLEISVKQLRAGKSKDRQRYCGNCGTEVVSDDRFCVHCGVDLSKEEVGG